MATAPSGCEIGRQNGQRKALIILRSQSWPLHCDVWSATRVVVTTLSAQQTAHARPKKWVCQGPKDDLTRLSQTGRKPSTLRKPPPPPPGFGTLGNPLDQLQHGPVYPWTRIAASAHHLRHDPKDPGRTVNRKNFGAKRAALLIGLRVLLQRSMFVYIDGSQS